MSYELSFSDAFYAWGDEVETGELQLNSKRQPVTLYSAIALLISQLEQARADLRDCGVHYFDRPSELGAQYCEVSECDGPMPEGDE